MSDIDRETLYREGYENGKRTCKYEIETLEGDNKRLSGKVDAITSTFMSRKQLIEGLEGDIELLNAKMKEQRELLTKAVNALDHGASEEITNLDLEITRYLVKG